MHLRNSDNYVVLFLVVHFPVQIEYLSIGDKITDLSFSSGCYKVIFIMELLFNKLRNNIKIPL
jgi:hypothetical protein